MKRHTDYTDAELLELYEAGKLDTLIDLECAHAGASLLPTVPVKPEKVEATPDLTLFKVGSLRFGTMGDAAKVLELATSLPLYDTSYAPGAIGYSTYIRTQLGPNDYSFPKIEQEKVFSADGWDKVKKDVVDYQLKLKAYESAKKEYDEAAKAREKIAADIFDRISNHRDYLCRKQQAQDVFERYLTLAEGNVVIAGNFMKAAKGDLWEEFGNELMDLPTKAPAETAKKD